VNCRAGHTKAGDDPTGELVIEGTKAACRGCHSKDYEELFTQWQDELRAQLAEAQALMAQVEKRLAAFTTTQATGRDLDEARRLFARAKGNIDLVATAGGMHNRYYSLLLLDQADMDLRHARPIMISRDDGAGAR
jgi:hypothetical protein